MNRVSESLRILLWTYVFVYVVVCSLQITQVDIWWQLSEGFHILSTFSLPSEPAAAYGLPASPYFDEYAGYEVILALLYKATGFAGLWMLFISVYLTIIFLPSLSSDRNTSTFDMFSVLALLSAALLMKQRYEQRPELVGGLLQVFLMIQLRTWQLESVTWKSLTPLFFIFLVWTNTHSTFLIGLFTLGLWIGCEMVIKYRNIPIRLLMTNALMVGVVALFATLLNPYGPWRLAFPFLQALDPGSTALSPEMWPIMNFRSVPAISAYIAVALLTWAVVTTRKTPLWLVLFSIFSIYMTAKSFRCVSLLAIALLFVYAARNAGIKSDHPPSLPVSLLKSAGLIFLCLFMLFGDAYNFVFTFNEITSERYFATHTSRDAPEIVDRKDLVSAQRLPVLCGHGEGSYLSFAENKSFRPLIDSGLSHFSDDTKRYFFFIWHKPEALALALKSLNLNHVIINKDTFHWILFMRDCPGWKLAACSDHGMLWERAPGGVYIPTQSDLEEIIKSRDLLMQRGDFVGAFCYSTLCDRPGESLAILSKYDDFDWSESMFNYINAWVASLSPSAIQQFLATDDAKRNLPLDAMLSARLGTESYAQFVKTVPPGPKPWFWQIMQIRQALILGDKKQAREIFETISTTQPSSVTYYDLWRQVKEEANPASDDNLSAYGRWQIWDDRTKGFMESMSARLNERILYLKGSNGP